MRVVITGTGIVSPVGIGNDEFRSALVSGKFGISEITTFATKGCRGGVVKNFDFENLFGCKRFRRVDDVTKFALVAAKEALEDSGLDTATVDSSRVGLVVGITHGAIGFSTDFHGEFIADGSSGASPALFSDSVLNAPTGNLSLALNVRGPSHTLVGDSTVGLQAVALGAELVKRGGVDACIVVATEELNERVFEAYSKSGMIAKKCNSRFDPKPDGFLPGEGAGSVLLESADCAKRRGVAPLAEISGYAAYSSGNLKEGIIKGFSKAVKMAGLESGNIKNVVTGTNGSFKDMVEGSTLGGLLKKGVMATTIKPIVGESFGATAVMGVIVAALSISGKSVLPNGGLESTAPEWSWARFNTHSSESLIENTLLLETGFRGDTAFAILKRIV